MSNKITDDELITEVRSWLGTKWVHGQSVKGAGVDCIHFPMQVYKNLGVLPEDYKMPTYARDWAMHNKTSLIERGLEELCDRLPTIDDAEIGDIVVFKTGMTTGHAGIYIGDGRVIHSEIRNGVREDNLSRFGNDVHSVWRVR